MAILNVKDFGATGDGITNDTISLNKAIQSSGNGDIVFIPNGNYFVGTLMLKSNITLKMDINTTLIASSDINDYTPPKYLPDDGRENVYGTQSTVSVLCAENVENAIIEGGRILFDDLSFDKQVENNPIVADDNYVSGLEYFRKPTYAYVPDKQRPIGTNFIHCNNITVKNLFYEKCPMWASSSIYCHDMVFDGVKVRNSKYQWCGDGIDFCESYNIEVKNCDISASDDCIAICSVTNEQCRDIYIHNNIFESTIHVIRLFNGLIYGTEKTCGNDFDKLKVCKILMENCKVKNAAGFLLIDAYDGNINDIIIRNIEFNQEYEGTAISINAKTGTVSNINISNCAFKSNGIGYFYTEGEGKIKEFVIEKCDFTITPKLKMWGDKFPLGMATHTYSMPYNLQVINVEELTLKNVNIKWGKAKFSDTFKPEEREAIIKAIGIEKLNSIEPKEIKAINSTNSNIKIIDSHIEDYHF